eukprot:CAMPEP_0113660232 /NCGR_PEP_ID=MMETSP0017_2-20120614/32785_1 /TAXON_ID=2856 /ORGANISM="Cylindrotheca closterium" /LENGTH=268 /DNA_ID=CAMNT_0000574843 /DNA_START=349 /DNA_END=1155 /DNA_ORIENTATION=- /assembly_acc=CAM_ASM_000147
MEIALQYNELLKEESQMEFDMQILWEGHTNFTASVRHLPIADARIQEMLDRHLASTVERAKGEVEYASQGRLFPIPPNHNHVHSHSLNAYSLPTSQEILQSVADGRFESVEEALQDLAHHGAILKTQSTEQRLQEHRELLISLFPHLSGQEISNAQHAAIDARIDYLKFQLRHGRTRLSQGTTENELLGSTSGTTDTIPSSRTMDPGRAAPTLSTNGTFGTPSAGDRKPAAQQPSAAIHNSSDDLNHLGQRTSIACLLGRPNSPPSTY